MILTNRLLRPLIATLLLIASGVVLATIPLGTPHPDDIWYPDDEPHSAREIELGKLLYFDTRLSHDQARSCASCHNPDLGFGDGMRRSPGIDGQPLGRNTPHIYNMAWNTVFFWDGRAATLEEQAIMPIQAAEEMNLPMAALVTRLQAVPYYREEFSAVYGSSAIDEAQIGRALAAFMRTVVADNSPFDRYLQGEQTAMSPEAVRGLALFEGKARCHLCHDSPNLTDESFHSLGIDDEDLGRGGVIGVESLNHAFKTPGLRNATLTYPYMHDGSLPDLEAVIRFYNRGGGDAAHKSNLMQPLNLTESEIVDLIAFLGALESPVRVTRPTLP